MSGTGGLVRTIGLRHLVERRRRTFLTAGGIAAGVALVFSITSIHAALNETIRSTVGAFSGPADLQVTAIATGTIDATVVEGVRSTDGVAVAAPMLQTRSTLTSEDREVDAFVLGGTADLLAFAPDPVTSGAGDGLAVGARLARDLRLEVGDRISVGTPAAPVELRVSTVLPEGPLDRINSGMVAVLPLPVAQEVFQRPDEVDLVLVDLDDGQAVDPVEDLRRVVGTTGIVTTPDDAPGDRAENVQPFLMLNEAIGLIALFVSLVLVFNTMSMAMAERRGELALAAALGARRRQLFLAILGEAATIGVAGTALGLAGGALLADVLLGSTGDSMRTVLPVDPPTGAVLVGPHLAVAAVSGVGVAVLGAILPARRVLRTAPIAALRPANDYEWVPDEGRRRHLVPLLAGVALLAAGMGIGLGLHRASPSLGRSAVVVVMILAGVTILLPTALPLVTNRIGTLLERRWAVIGRLAGDALRANPRRTSITLATLILPLATVIGMGTAFSSAQAKFHDLALTFIASPIVVNSDSFDGYTAMQALPPDTAALIEAVPGVRAALPTQNMFLTTEEGLAILYANPLSVAERKGVPDALHDAENADDPDAFRAGLRQGDVAVSRLAARNRELDIGDPLTLPTTSGPVEFRVAALFDDLAGVDTIYVDRDTFLRHWADDRVSGFGVATDDGADPSAVAAAIRATLDDRDLPVEVLERGAAVARLEEGLTGLFSVARTIQLAAVVVAALSLTSTAFTTILERRWTLGLQQALGMSRAQIARSLALEAAAVAIIGGLAAAAVGIAIGVLISQSFAIVTATHLPVTIPWPVVAACAVGALALSLAATAYPRRLATRVQIIEALVTE